jgi:hypothetical protein
MTIRLRLAFLASTSALAIGLLGAATAQANVLSLLPGSCGNQVESQPFAQWGDYNDYTLMPGGTFEPGGAPWSLTGGAAVVSGNESFDVSGPGSHSLSLPARSSATSPAACTSIYDPTLRLFVRNTGSSSSRLDVYALTPGLLGGVMSTRLAQISASSSWEPSSAMGLLLNNLLATLSLDQTAIAFRFVPADSSGQWSIDDVYLDPYMRG